MKVVQTPLRISAFIEGDGSPWRALSREAILSSSWFNRNTLATVENRLRMGREGQRML